MVYFHVLHGVEFDEEDPQWIAAKQTFINPTGWLDGGSSYGILLSGRGTAVVNIGRRKMETMNIQMVNVTIHDLAIEPQEGVWAAVNTAGGGNIVHGFFFETLDWIRGGIYDSNTGYYGMFGFAVCL